MIVQLRFTLFGIVAALTTGLVYYLILDAAGWWLFGSVIGLHILMAHITAKMAYNATRDTIGTLAGECEKLAKYVQVLAKENKELKAKQGV